MSHIPLGNQLELFKWNISTSGSFGFFHKILQKNPNKLFHQPNRFLVMLEVNGLINQYWPVGMTVFFLFDKTRQCMKKQKHHFTGKGLYSQSYGLSSSHVQM